jgi:predicted Rossmann fold nucleotide-binding protein DprA/Smf involved in DNA uptake
MIRRILGLLEDLPLLRRYHANGWQADCTPITRVSEGYPVILRKRLGLESPGVLWAKGDMSLLEKPKISLVGSRDIEKPNADFAAAVGREAARQGYVLVSGNARGADRAAQDSCLDNGGEVIAIVADELAKYAPQGHILYLSEDGFDLPFSTQRALSRNRLIHCMGLRTFVAQCGYQRGGTWDGTVKNLRFGWSPVHCFRDGSPAANLLQDMGAEGVELDELHDFSALEIRFFRLFDQ